MKTPQSFSYRACAVVTGVNSSSAFNKQIYHLHHSRKKFIYCTLWRSIAIVITESLCTVWAVDVHCVADLIWLREQLKIFYHSVLIMQIPIGLQLAVGKDQACRKVQGCG